MHALCHTKIVSFLFLVFCLYIYYVRLHYDSIQETRKSIFSNMDDGILIKFGEMMFYLAVFIFDTGENFSVFFFSD